MSRRMHCPYCVTPDGFRELMKKEGGEYVCSTCGHSVYPEGAESRCCCSRCVSITIYVKHSGYSPFGSHDQSNRVNLSGEIGSD